MSSLAVKIAAPSLGGFELPVTSNPAGDYFQRETDMNKSSAILLSLVVAGCTEQQAQPVYVSPLEFKNYNCKQIAREMEYTSAQYNQMTAGNQAADILGAAVIAYGISRGYGFSTGGEDPQVSYLKAKYEALHQASIQKNCE